MAMTHGKAPALARGGTTELCYRNIRIAPLNRANTRNVKK